MGHSNEPLPRIQRKLLQCWLVGLLLGIAPIVASAADRTPPLFEKPGAFRELTHVRFQGVTEERSLSDSEIVVGVFRGNQQRAYPLRVLGEHRIINDNFGGPVVVTWDADSGSARAFIAEQDARRLNFRFQGWHLGVMVLRDNESGSLWSHLTGYSLGGERRGQHLEPLAVVVTTWSAWRGRYPESQIPEFDYRSVYKTTFPISSLKLSPEATRSLARPDDRLTAETRVLGVSHGGQSKAYRLDPLRELTLDRLGGRDIAILHLPSGETAVLESNVDGQKLRLHLESIGDALRLVDAEGEPVDLSGVILNGPRQGKRLPTVNAVETKWYAWAAYHPETLVDGLASTTKGVCLPILLPQPPQRPAREKPTPKATRKERRDQRRKAAAER